MKFLVFPKLEKKDAGIHDVYIKGALSCLIQFFFFISKALFILKIFKLLS